MKQSLLIFFLIIGMQSFGQSMKYEYAQKLTDRLDFERAYPIWCEISEDNNNADLAVLRQVSQMSFQMEKYEESLKWNTILLSKNSDSLSDYLRHFQLLCYNNRHDELKAAIDMASLKFKGDQTVMSWAKNHKEIMLRKSSVSDYTTNNFSTRSVGEQFSAIPYGKGILYVSTDDDAGLINNSYKRTGQEFLSICYLDTTELSKYKIWQKMFWKRLIYHNQWREIPQSTKHEGPISFNEEKTLAFLTSNQEYLDTIKNVKYSRLEQLVYAKNGEEWEQIPFPFNSHLFSCGHAVVDTNGWIIFVTDNPKYTMGGTDLVKTKLENGKWTEPVNLGSQVNTTGNELFPFVSDKGILYFSSNGWPSIGGLDIFSFDFYGEQPEHIGSPINTNADDFGFYLDEETGKGFISSNRENWSDKIYSIYKPPFKCTVSVALKSCKGNPLIDKTVTLTDTKTNKIISLKTDKKGKVTTSSLEKGRTYKVYYQGDKNMTSDSLTFESVPNGDLSFAMTSNYTEHVTALKFKTALGEKLDNIVMYSYLSDGSKKNQYVSTSSVAVIEQKGNSKVDSVTLEVVNYEDIKFIIPEPDFSNCTDTIYYTITLNRLPDSAYIQIQNILYDFDKYNLRPESKVELDKLISYMKSHPKYKVELQSHTDCRGTYKYNERLSRNRSKSCVNYILSKGISKDKITAKGAGEYELLENCPCEGDVISDCSDEQHQLNRRTVFLLITPENEILNNNKLKVD
jgi:outer membrane protein OmpA-like peptidoglycan-associated protein